MTKAEKSRIQKEIVDSIEIGSSGRLLLAPRVGKTKLMIDIIKRNKPTSILWITPSAELADKDNVEDGIFTEFVKWKAVRYINKLTTTTWKSLSKIKGHFDLIIGDEEQFATENNCASLLDNNLSFNNLLFMTGTSTKHEHKKNLYKNLNLSVLVDISINKAVDMGLLSNYSIKVIGVDLGKEKNIKAGNKTNPFLTTEEAQYKWLTKSLAEAIDESRPDVQYKVLSRLRAIKNSPSKENAALHLIKVLEGRKLIFSSTIKQASVLSNNTYHSKTDNKDLISFKKGDIDDIALVNAGGTGHTYKAIDHLIIVQADSDKNGLTSQKICRTLLDQKNYEATVWIICLIGSKDETWIDSTLESFDESKIEYIRFKDFKNGKKN